MDLSNITFVTGSENKVREAREVLGLSLKSLSMDLPEIQSLDLSDVVSLKARAAFEKLEAPVMVEDTSLIFLAWGKLPGTFIRWFIEELGPDGVLKMLTGDCIRSALAETQVALFDGRDLRLFRGETSGQIADRPRGANGFGWDQIFIPEAEVRTFAEMSSQEKMAHSMRVKALAKIKL